MSHSHTLVKHEDTLTLFLDALYSASVLSPVRVLDRRQLRVEDLLVSKAARSQSLFIASWIPQEKEREQVHFQLLPRGELRFPE